MISTFKETGASECFPSCILLILIQGDHTYECSLVDYIHALVFGFILLVPNLVSFLVPSFLIPPAEESSAKEIMPWVIWGDSRLGVGFTIVKLYFKGGKEGRERQS